MLKEDIILLNNRNKSNLENFLYENMVHDSRQVVDNYCFRFVKNKGVWFLKNKNLTQEMQVECANDLVNFFDNVYNYISNISYIDQLSEVFDMVKISRSEWLGVKNYINSSNVQSNRYMNTLKVFSVPNLELFISKLIIKGGLILRYSKYLLALLQYEDAIYIVTEGRLVFYNSVPDFSYLCFKNIFISNIELRFNDSLYEMFANCVYTEKIVLENFNTSDISVMSKMFRNCYNLTDIDLKNFNTEKVYNFEAMFENCENLKILDLNNFDMKSAQQLSSMFAGCFSLKKIIIDKWNLKNVISLNHTFYDCNSLETIDLFELLIYVKTNRTDLYCCFYGCERLKILGLLDSDWNIKIKGLGI